MRRAVRRSFRFDVSQIGEKICLHDALEGEEITTACGGKRQAETDRGGSFVEDGHALRCAVKTL